MNTIRNPNKFLHLVHFSFSILATFGLQHFYNTFINSFNHSKKSKKLPIISSLKKKLNFFLLLSILNSIFFLISILLFLLFQTSLKEYLLIILQNTSLIQSTLNNIIFYLFKGFFIFNISIFLLFILLKKASTFKQKHLKYLTVVIFSFAFIDQYLVNKFYFNFQPNFYQKIATSPDPIISFFQEQKKQENFRIKVIYPQNYLFQFERILAPINGLDFIGSSMVSRSQSNSIFNDFSNNIDDILQTFGLLNIKYIISQSSINTDKRLKLVQEFSFNQENIFIYELTQYSKRIYIPKKIFLVQNQENTFNLIKQNDFLLNENTTINLSSSNDLNNQALLKSFDISKNSSEFYNNSNKSNKIVAINNISNMKYLVKLNLKSNTIVNFSTPSNNLAWNAYDNQGNLLAKYKTNYFFHGFLVSKDVKSITIRYGENPTFFNIFYNLLTTYYNYLCLYLILISILVYLVINYFKNLKNNLKIA